jgi:chaperonin GroEL
MRNGGVDDTVPNYKHIDEGFNALTGHFGNLAEAGVYDPVKVAKNSFLAAMSIAQLFYSTEVAVLLEE